MVDAISMVLVAQSWLDKRSLDHDENGNGYFWMRMAIILVLVSTPVTIYQAFFPPTRASKNDTAAQTNVMTSSSGLLSRGVAFLSKFLILIMIVTGPATAATVLIACLQGWILFLLCSATGFYEVSYLQALVVVPISNQYQMDVSLVCAPPHFVVHARISGITTGFSSFVSLPYSAHFLCDESWVCFQSTSLLLCFCGHHGIRL
jgi:hypothetical protein